MEVGTVAKQPTRPKTQSQVSTQKRPGIGFYLALLLLTVLGIGAWWAAGTQVLRCNRTASAQVDCVVEQRIGPFVQQQAQLTKVVDATNEIKTEMRLFRGRPREVVLSDMIVLIGANEQRLPAISGQQFYLLNNSKQSVDTNGLYRFLRDTGQTSFTTWRSTTYIMTFIGYGFLLFPVLFVVRMLLLLVQKLRI